MFEESHETLERLRRLFAGETSPYEEQRAAEHLTGCRDCWLLAARAITAQRAARALVVQGPLRKIVELQEAEQERALDLVEAEAEWPEVLALPEKARKEKVRTTRALHTLGAVEFLLEAGAAAEKLVDANERFGFSLIVAQQLPASKFSSELKSDLCAECCAEVGNTRRRLARWPAARDILKKGLEYAARGTRNGVAEGKVLCVEGALEDDLCNAEGAAAILRRAESLFEAAGQPFLRSRTLTQLAYVLVDTDPAACLLAVDPALAILPAGNPRLTLTAERIKIDCLVTLSSPHEALLRLTALRPLHLQFQDPNTRLARKFTTARILESLGRLQKAESLLEEVMAGDLEHGLVKDYYMDLLYLCGFHLRQGRKDAAIAVCRRGGEDLSRLVDEEARQEPSHVQMRDVWKSLEQEIRTGKADLGALPVLKNYVKAHWKAPADKAPSFSSSQPSA